MTTELEIAHEAFLQTKDEGRPHCGACDRTNRVVDIVICAECGGPMCVECLGELKMEIEACSEACAVVLVRKLITETSRLRAVRGRRESGEDRQFIERRAA